MKESYREGLALHPAPESCAGDRKVMGEALTGGHVGRGIELRNHPSGVPTLSEQGEGHMVNSVMRELLTDTAESQTHGMRGNSMRGSRETPKAPSRVVCGGRSAKAKRRTTDMHVFGESDGPIVPRKRANKAAEAAESVEGRGPTKGNADQTATSRTQSRNMRVGCSGRRTTGDWSPARPTRGRSRMR